ncbi:restriction endonuclease subunit S [Chryseobacterium oranimense]|uniref:restriction endonuclease subunit S n=1 Tax=Chryseobacterium oranimense TaxID=421058 RepID=UPI0031D7A928
MEDWHEFKLNELGKVGRGKSKHRPRNEPSLFGGEYPFIQTGDIKSANFYVTKYSQTYNEKGLAQSKIWKKGTLCITIAANIAETAILGIDACFPDSIIGFIADKNKSDVRFIKYYFDILKIHLQSISQGTTQDNLSQEKLLKFSFTVPKNVEDQERIASVLSAYDDLIENNNERIKLLEETARQLYKEWFVRLRFPGYKETKFSKGRPEKWKDEKWEKYLNIIRGRSYTSAEIDDNSGKWAFINLKNINRGGGFRLDGTKYFSGKLKEEQIVYPGDIVMAVTDMTQERSIVGRVARVPLSEHTNYGISLDICKIEPVGLPKSFVYASLRFNTYGETLAEYANGTNVLHLKPELLKKEWFLMPDLEVINKFVSVVEPLFNKIDILTIQNTQLRATRDRLLPRLISGKLQVKPHSDFNKTKIIESHQVIDTIEKSTEDTKVKSNPFFQRRVLAAHIIDRLKDESTFGHVKLMKLMYLFEHLAEIETASHYHRDAAGPYDNRMIRSIDSQLKKAQWFECKKTGNKYQYTALPKKDEYKNWFSKYYSDKEAGIENLLHLFGKEKTEKAEMVATLYEAWRDLKDKKQLATEQAIIYEVLNNWHESKQRISEERWLKCLQWMKEKNWIT